MKNIKSFSIAISCFLLSVSNVLCTGGLNIKVADPINNEQRSKILEQVLNNSDQFLDSLAIDSIKVHALDKILNQMTDNFFKYQAITRDQVQLIEFDQNLNQEILQYLGINIWEYLLLFSRKDQYMQVTIKDGLTKVNVPDDVEQQYKNLARLGKRAAAKVKEHVQRRSHYLADKGNILESLRRYFSENNIAENPINSIYECNRPECVLTRSNSPVRRFCENEIIKRADKTSVYVSHASGSLYQDFIILNKLLAQGKKVKTIILIDPLYQALIQACKLLDYDSVVLSEHIEQLEDFGPNIDANMSLLPLSERVEVLLAYKSLVQFTRWFTHDPRCSDDPIEIIVYASADIYMKDCLESKVSKAHLIVGVDYFRSNNIRYDQPEHNDFKKLQDNVLASNGLSFELIKLDPPQYNAPNTVVCCIKNGPSNREDIFVYNYQTQLWEEKDTLETKNMFDWLWSICKKPVIILPSIAIGSILLYKTILQQS